MKQRIKVEKLTSALFEQYEGSPPPISIKGVTVTVDGKPVVIACVSQFTTPKFVMFDASEDISSTAIKRYIIKAFKMLQPLLEEGVLAHQDKEKPTSDSFLRHFGFAPLDGEYYIYRGE